MVYGSADGGETVKASNDKAVQLMRRAASFMNLKGELYITNLIFNDMKKCSYAPESKEISQVYLHIYDIICPCYNQYGDH